MLRGPFDAMEPLQVCRYRALVDDHFVTTLGTLDRTNRPTCAGAGRFSPARSCSYSKSDEHNMDPEDWKCDTRTDAGFILGLKIKSSDELRLRGGIVVAPLRTERDTKSSQG